MCISLILALVISIINGYVFWWVSVSIIFLLSLYYYDSRLVLNPLTITVFAFILLLTLNMIFVHPANNTNAAYLILFFASGFLLFSFASDNFIKQSVTILCALFLLLSIWGLTQYLTGSGYLVYAGQRANAIFYTPNSFAACINIILLPLTIFYVHKKESQKIYALILVLFLALLVTQSRGGWTAFIVSIFFIYILCRILVIDINKNRLKKLTIGFVLVFSTYCFIELVDLKKIEFGINQSDRNFGLIFKNDVSHLVRTESVVSTMSHRTMLYDIAWQQIKEKPITGHGLHTYQYFQVRDQHAPHIGNATRFAHNDYLQLWMETGILGLTIFISIPVMIISMLFISWKEIAVSDRAIMLALMTGLVGFYVQALVGFLFYTPFLIMMYGCYLGYFNQLFNKNLQGCFFYTLKLPCIMIRPVVIKSLVGLVVVSYLSQPAVAQLAFDQANRDKKRLDIESALVYYEMARRFAPYESSYYLVEGDIWYHAAKVTGESEPAQRADKLYEQGVKANPYEVASLFWRAILHRDMPELLSNAVSHEVVLSWFQNVLQWLPNNQQAQSEYVRTLFLIGEYEKATQLLDDYLVQNPDSYYLIKVRTELVDSS